MITIAIIGPGAVGTSIAMALANTSVQVDLLGKRDETLTFHEYATSEQHAVSVKALKHTNTHYDWLIVAVKTTQLDAILADIERLCHKDTRIILAQNGYGQRDKITHPYVYPAVVYISGQKTYPHVTHFRDYRLHVQDDHHTRALAQILASSKLELTLERNIEHNIWYKLLVNLGINTVTALGRDTSKVLKHPSMAQLCRNLIDEGLRVAQADGLQFEPSLTDDIMTIYKGYPEDMGTSMYYDLTHQKPLEIDAIQGYIQKRAQLHHIATPHLDTAFALLQYEHEKAQTS